MPTSDPWAKYPEKTQGTVAAPQDDPWAKYPEVSQEPSFLGKVKDTFVDAASTALGTTLNPIGTLNKIPYVQDVIPDWYDNGPEKGIAKGGYNSARHTLQLGADIQDYVLPGNSTPMSDALKVIPEADYSGIKESVAGHITEIASGFLLGNKMGNLAKTEKLGADAVAAAEKLAPEAAHKLITFATSIIKGGIRGVVGTGITTKPGSTNLAIGKKALVTKLGLGPIMEGLPTDSPDAAQNALAARLNTGLDAFITGAGITYSAKLLKTLYHALPGPAVVEKLKPLWSDTAKIKVFFEQIGQEAQKIPGVDTPKGLQRFHERVVELASNINAGTLAKSLGIPRVDPISESLDTATTVARQIPKKGATELDQGIKTTLDAQAKQLQQRGYEKTAGRREAPTRALSNALEQTQEVLGGPTVAQKGAEDIQTLGKAAVKQGESEKLLKQNEVTNLAGHAANEKPSIIHHVEQAEDLRTVQRDALYDKVDPTFKADQASFAKVVTENKDNMPAEITDILKSKDNDGSFKFLNNVLRPKISALLAKTRDATDPAVRKEVIALKKLRENIDGDQIDFLKNQGRQDIVDAAEKAKSFHETEIAQNRQGIVGKIQDILNKHGKNREDAFTEGREALKKEIGNPEHPEHTDRLWNVLASDEGARSEALLEQYKSATDKVSELDKIEKQVYGDKLREFFDQKAVFPGTNNPNGVESFQMLLDDKQNANRIKDIVDMAKDTPSVQTALEYSYARKLHESLYSGHLSELGAPLTNAPGVKGILNNDGFLEAGEIIFKNNPEFMTAVKDTLELANDIQKLSYMKPAPSGPMNKIAEAAKQGLKTAISPILGPLSHKGYMAKTYFGAFLDVLKPQAAVDRMADALMANGLEYAKAYHQLTNIKASKKQIETATKALSAMLFRNDGEREKFDKKFKELKTESQTDEILKKNSYPSEKLLKPLKLTKQEQNIADHHADILRTHQYVMNKNGMTSTVKMLPVEKDGKFYAVPTVWDGKILSDAEATKRAGDLSQWPSYGSREELNKRYDEMHTALEADINYLEENDQGYQDEQWKNKEANKDPGRKRHDEMEVERAIHFK